MASTEYKKIDDQTLIVSQDISGETTEIGTTRHLRQVFNFRSQQLTTVWESRYHYSGVSSSITTQNFSEIDGKGALADAREKLLELGGNPDPLEEPEEGKRKHGKSPLKLG